MADNGGQSCIICAQKGVDGITPCGKLICAECEREIVRAGILNTRYDFYLERLKQIWVSAAGRHF